MLVPNDAQSFDLAQGFGSIQERNSPFARACSRLDMATYYHGLTSDCKMAFLNIEAKLRETRLDDRPALDFVEGVLRVEADRVYLWFLSEAKAKVAHSPDFSKAAGHGSMYPDSWKHTQFSGGNLQLSFGDQPARVDAPGKNPGRDCFLVDVDIDLARGLGHAAEWLRNNVFEPGHKTDQREVYRLLYEQGILPVYTLAQAAPGLWPT